MMDATINFMNIKVSGRQEKRQSATAISYFAVFYTRNTFNKMVKKVDKARNGLPPRSFFGIAKKIVDIEADQRLSPPARA